MNNVGAIVGLALATLSLTYVLQVVTAVTDERTVASDIAALGSTPDDAVASALRSVGFRTFPLQLSSIAEGLSATAQAHLAFPMLQFFHSQEPASSVAVNLARFDEIVTLLDHAVPEDHVPTVRAGRSAVDRFLATLDLPASPCQPPPVPSLTTLRDVRGDIVDDEAFAAAVADLAPRRSALQSLVRAGGWS